MIIGEAPSAPLLRLFFSRPWRAPFPGVRPQSEQPCRRRRRWLRCGAGAIIIPRALGDNADGRAWPVRAILSPSDCIVATTPLSHTRTHTCTLLLASDAASRPLSYGLVRCERSRVQENTGGGGSARHPFASGFFLGCFHCTGKCMFELQNARN